jgi:4'-phosphopantetheinyl transferase
MSNSILSTAEIFLLDIDEINDSQITSSLVWLAPTELVRYQRIARQLRQRQFLAGRLLLRYALAKLLKIPAQHITLTEQERQAPLLHIGGMTAQLPYFSISHTGNWAACACSRSIQLGLDIELLDARRDLDAISQHTFHADDVAWLKRQPDQVAAFYRLWSIKEARYKLTQQYKVGEAEHCYEVPHADMSVVLMANQALAAKPQCTVMRWSTVADYLSD